MSIEWTSPGDVPSVIGTAALSMLPVNGVFGGLGTQVFVRPLLVSVIRRQHSTDSAHTFDCIGKLVGESTATGTGLIRLGS